MLKLSSDLARLPLKLGLRVGKTGFGLGLRIGEVGLGLGLKLCKIGLGVGLRALLVILSSSLSRLSHLESFSVFQYLIQTMLKYRLKYILQNIDLLQRNLNHKRIVICALVITKACFVAINE